MRKVVFKEGQGALEYLLLIAGVVLFAVVALLVIFPFTETGGNILADDIDSYEDSVDLDSSFDDGSDDPDDTPLVCIPNDSCDVSGGETAANCLVDCHCGDSVCQLGSFNEPATCPMDCPVDSPVCGNGDIESSEVCDDGNTSNEDGCSGSCTIESGFSCDGNPSVCVEDPVDPDDPSPLTYQYNAKFEPPIGRVIHGMGQWDGYNDKYVTLLTNTDTTMNPFSGASSNLAPAAQLIFINLVDDPVRPWDTFVLPSVTTKLAELKAKGIIPHIDIFFRGNQPLVIDPDNPYYGIDEEIVLNTGDFAKWESHVNDLALLFKEYEEPIFLRIGGEFNGAWSGYEPYMYPLAFREVVEMFRDAGADNVAFVWCYMPAAPDDFAEQNALGDYKWFPGNDVIDWYSIDVFGHGDFSGPLVKASGGNTPHGKSVAFLNMAESAGKPVYIAESSVSHLDITPDLSDGMSDWSTWFVNYFLFIETHPVIKGFNYINFNWPLASFYAFNGWKNGDITNNAYISQQYLDELNKSRYLHRNEKHLLNHYTDYSHE